MTPQESDLIMILLDRLKKTEGQKEPEAEALIRQAIAERHGAPYYLVQTVLIQDLSLHNAQSRIADLQTQLTGAKSASSAPPSFLGAPSFPGAVFGRGDLSDDVRTSNVPLGGRGTGSSPLATTLQPGYAAQPGSAAPPAPGAGLTDGGGFLRSAAMTAAGIAGGALLFEGIQSMFGHHDAASITANQTAISSLGETVLNNHYGAETSASAGGSTDGQVGAGYDPDLPDATAASDKDFTSSNPSWS
jgi:uncharacterized protein